MVLHNCGIKNIDKEWLAGLVSLEELELGGNQIDKLETNTFVGLKKLRKLLLSEGQRVYSSSSSRGELVSIQEFQRLLREFTNDKLEVTNV